MVAVNAINGTAHRVADQATRHGLPLDLGVNLSSRIERCFAFPVRDNLDTAKQASAANIAHMGRCTERRFKAALQSRAHGIYVRQRLWPCNDLNHFVGGRGGHRVAKISMAMLKQPRPIGKTGVDVGR